MKYTAKDLYKGMKLRCVSTIEPHWWNIGKQYEVEKRTDGLFILKDETGYIWNSWLILDFLNGKSHCKMEIVEEEKEMKYTENDIKVGTKLRCTKATPEWWTVGKDYDVTLNEEYGDLNITDDDGSPALTSYILDCLNGKHNPVAFEIVEEEKEMTKYVEVTKLIDWSRDPELLEVGKVYKVAVEYKESLYMKGVSIYVNENEPYYYLLSDQFKYVEQNEEEKEMKKYAKITKYAGLIDTDKENGLEIGKEYEIVKFSSVSEDCWVYLNDKRPEYFISETQYELVEKEEPTLKANVNVDVKEAIQAKIDELTTEEEHLFTKRDRLEKHAINLNKKAQKLKKVLETIKEFE